MTFEAFHKVVDTLGEKYEPIHLGKVVWDEELNEDETRDYNLKIPPWICQPHFRMPPEDHIKKLESCEQAALTRPPKVKYVDKEGNRISRNHYKKIKRLENRVKIKIERQDVLCVNSNCCNDRGLKCDFSHCKNCCKKKCEKQNLKCCGHEAKLWWKENQARYKESEEIQAMDDD